LSDSPLGLSYRLDDLQEEANKGAKANPDAIMMLLRYGTALDKGAAQARPPFGSTRWVQVVAMPPAEPERIGPVEEILLASIGSRAEFEFVVQNTGEQTGLELLIGFPDDDASDGSTGLVAPRLDVVRSRPDLVIEPIMPRDWHQAGIVHRLEFESDLDNDERLGTSVLERMSVIPGPWQVSWIVRGTGVSAIDDFAGTIEMLESSASERRSISRQVGATTTSTIEAPAWVRVQEWLAAIRAQLIVGRSIGLWSTTTHVQARQPGAFDALCSALRHGLPLRRKQLFSTGVYLCAPDGAPPVSLLTSAQLGQVLTAPSQSMLGMRIRRAPPSGRKSSSRAQPLSIGSSWGTSDELRLDVDDLVGHGFITGTTGAGKTTTVTRLLAELWNEHRIPFLIIDPVKDDYSGSAASFDGGLRVITGSKLRVDLLKAWPGEDLTFHINRIAQAFRGAFTMPTPVPYIVTQLFDMLVEQDSGPEHTSLFDIRAALGPLVASLGYAPEIESNIRAALMTRLNLLLSPSRAHRFCWSDSAMLHDLFTMPTVVTLGDLGDDEERSFVVLVLALAVWQAARSRKNPRRVEHVLALEEAHRVIPEVGGGQSASGEVSTGSAEAESATMLTSLLAEVRSFGQSVLVLDQSPAKVAQDVVRNTNLKILHKLLHPDDQRQAGGSIGLDDDQCRVLGALVAGEALISTSAVPEPQTIKVAMPDRRYGKSMPPAAGAPDWPCCGEGATAQTARKHYRAWNLAPHAEAAVAMLMVGLRTGAGDGVKLRAAIYDQLGLVAAEGAGLNRSCLVWAGIRTILVRERALGRVPSSARFLTAMSSTYEAWRRREPLTKVTGDHCGLPASASLCPACGRRCRVRVPASILLRHQPTGGLMSTWMRAGDDLTKVIAWLKAEAAGLEPQLGSDATWELLRCFVGHAVVLQNLPRPVIDHVVTSAR
jgi:hypothetical protein